MFGEHIEEMIKLFKADEIPLVPYDIAEAVMDIAFAQGLLTHDDNLDLAHKQIEDEVRYMLHPSEVV